MPDSIAIQHSRQRLNKVRSALARLETAAERVEIESAWSDLLLAASGIYSKLEQGSKANGRASAWFGRVKSERKQDPLLSYVHHARNSDEHGIENITQFAQKGQATITFREPYDPAKLEGLQLTIGRDALGNVRVQSSNEDVVTTKMFDKNQVILVAVRDVRYGDVFEPPYEHLGVKIENQTPLEIARLLTPYLERLIEQAVQFGI